MNLLKIDFLTKTRESIVKKSYALVCIMHTVMHSLLLLKKKTIIIIIIIEL